MGLDVERMYWGEMTVGGKGQGAGAGGERGHTVMLVWPLCRREGGEGT